MSQIGLYYFTLTLHILVFTKGRSVEYVQYLEENQNSLKDVQISENGHILRLGSIDGNVDKLVARRMKGRGRS